MSPTEVITRETLRQVAVDYIAQQGIVAGCERVIHNARLGYSDPLQAQKEMAVQATRLAKIAQELIQQADALECEEVLIVKTGKYTYWGIKIDYGAAQVVSTFPVEVLLEEVDEASTAAALAGLRALQHFLEGSRPQIASILDIATNSGSLPVPSIEGLDAIAENLNLGE